MSIPGIDYRSPYRFTFRQRLALATLPFLAATVLKLLMRTCRITVRYGKRRTDYEAKNPHALVAFWHEVMGFAGWQHRGSGGHTLTSYSYDGELAARLIRYLGLRACRGSSSRGGAEALHQLQTALEHAPLVGFTLDGPRGPRREAKAGIAVLAGRSGVPIMPIACAIDRAWRLKSWDRFPVPKPFARITIAYGESIPPPEDLSPEAVEKTRLAVEQHLNELHREIEEELGGDAPQ